MLTKASHKQLIKFEHNYITKIKRRFEKSLSLKRNSACGCGGEFLIVVKLKLSIGIFNRLW